jgi:hypothetical protein
MRVITIKEALAMGDGESVPAVKGTLTAVYDRKAGENSNGPWSFQDCVLKDSTGEIKVKLKDRDALDKTLKGKVVYLACIKSDKHGMVGVKRKDDEYKGKVSQILWVTSAAIIDQDAPGADEAQAAPQAHNEAPPGNDAPDAVKAARQEAARIANGYIIALAAADFVLSRFNAEHDQTMTDEQYQAMTSTIFIAIDRHGVIAGLPTGPLPQAGRKPPEPVKPQPEDDLPF